MAVEFLVCVLQVFALGICAIQSNPKDSVCCFGVWIHTKANKLSNLSVCAFFVCLCVFQKPWPQSQDLQNREVRQQRFAHFTELAIMSVQEIVDFAKQLPGFLELTREDQIALLKTSTIEVCHDLSRCVVTSLMVALLLKCLFWSGCKAL